MSALVEILLAGSGGQGLGLAGVLLARSLAEEEGKNVLETEAYGISMRGGHSRAEILVSSGEISELKVTQVDILLAMSQAAADAFVSRVKKGGLVLLDSGQVKDVSTDVADIASLPFTEEARKLGREAVANVIALGSITALSTIIRQESLAKTLEKAFSASAKELNLKALVRGYELGKNIA